MFLFAFDRTRPRFIVVAYLVAYLPCVFPIPLRLAWLMYRSLAKVQLEKTSLQYQSITLLSSSYNHQLFDIYALVSSSL
jgi:hypothetical protein